jgi:hypothetical protein
MHLYTAKSVGVSPTEWRKSSYSWANGDCVEVSSRSGGFVRVRDTRNPGGAMLAFGQTQWDAFVGGIRSGGDDRR